MQVETLMLIAYCFGAVLNILIAVGILGKRKYIDMSDIIIFMALILLSWAGTGCIVGYALVTKYMGASPDE